MTIGIPGEKFRRCIICGKPMACGMTDTDGDGFYCCEGECFEKYMDETYGKHRWMEINDDGEGGYYIYSDENILGGYFGTGIFYTEWFDDEEWTEELARLEEEGEKIAW